MTGTGIGQTMIERYLREQRYRFDRADDGDYLAFISSGAGHFQVYLRSRVSSPNVVRFAARSGMEFAHADRNRLLEWANSWNDRDPWVTASIRDTHDGSQLRIVGNSTVFVAKDSELPVFRRFADLSFASAVKLFEAADSEMNLPSPTDLQRWFEWEG